jgi:ABC-2 type transport system ATP-binding protein
MSQTPLKVEGLSRFYGPLHAVRDISFEVRQGEVLGFLGPNGAGKTTTMQMLTGNLAPSAGAVTICGIDLFESPVQAKSHIGYLPEVPPLYREFKVIEFLEFAARLHRVPRARCAAAVTRACERCGLQDVSGQLIGTLSKGFQQRVGIAQAIVHEPDVIILDEPTVGLDPNQLREMRALIRQLGSAHSVILSTHILPEVEAVCDRVQIMHHGTMVYSDTIAELRQMYGGHTLLVGFTHPPVAADLENIEGVAQAETLHDSQFRIHVRAGADPTETLIAAAARRGWGLRQIGPAQVNLEDVFANLTRRDAQ